jgi:hypothetical protein
MFSGSLETAVRDFKSNIYCSRLLTLALSFNPQYDTGSGTNISSENKSSAIKKNYVNVLKLGIHQ